LGLYDLRHTFASLLVAASTSTIHVSVQLGHMNPSTTLRHCVRWIPNKGRRMQRTAPLRFGT